jgi:hypothetical protein
MTKRDFAARQRLAELLERVPTMAQDDSRTAVLGMFRDRGYELPPLPAVSVQIICYQVIDFAARQAGALQQLSETVRWADRSSAAENFVDEVRHQLPGDFFALDDRLEFIGVLRDLIQPDELEMYYTRATRDICESRLLDVSDLVGELEELTSDDPCHPLVFLTEEIAQRAKKLHDCKIARHWSYRLAGLIDSSKPQDSGEERAKLARLRESRKKSRKNRGPAPGVEPASLVVKLDPHVPRPEEGYKLSMWLYRAGPSPDRQLGANDTPLSLDAIRDEVIDKLSEVIVSLRKPGTFTEISLEFFLPRDLLDYAVENWLVKDQLTLGTQFVVVIRDGDRLNSPALWPPWQQKWMRVADSGSRPEGPFSRWITCMDEPCRPGELSPSLLLAEDLISLGLTFPPPPSARRLELMEALNAGTPIAVWPRGRCAHPVPASTGGPCQGVAFMESLSQELAGRAVTELPALVQELRRKRAAAGDSRPGLALLWDNPDRLPISSTQLDAPPYLPH